MIAFSVCGLTLKQFIVFPCRFRLLLFRRIYLARIWLHVFLMSGLATLLSAYLLSLTYFILGERWEAAACFCICVFFSPR